MNQDGEEESAEGTRSPPSHACARTSHCSHVGVMLASCCLILHTGRTMIHDRVSVQRYCSDCLPGLRGRTPYLHMGPQRGGETCTLLGSDWKPHVTFYYVLCSAGSGRPPSYFWLPYVPLSPRLTSIRLVRLPQGREGVTGSDTFHLLPPHPCNSEKLSDCVSLARTSGTDEPRHAARDSRPPQVSRCRRLSMRGRFLR